MGTLVTPGEYDGTCASFGPPESTTQMANQSVQLFLHSARQKVPILYNGRPFLPNYPFLWGDMDPHPSYDSLGPSEPIIHTVSLSVQPFCTDDRTVSLYFTTRRQISPSKLPLPMGDLDPHVIHGSLDLPKPLTQTASHSVQPFLQGSRVTCVTDRPTDQQTDRPRYLVGNKRPHLHT